MLRAIRVLCLSLFGLSSFVFAQINTATLLGTVKDASGAVVPNALVTVKNLATAATRSVTTGATGDYTVTNLAVGHYSISVAATGFKAYTVPDVELQVAQKAQIDAVLQVGAATEEVTVAAAAPLLSTASSSVGQVVDTHAVERMPLNGRSFWQLTQLTPGATYIPGGQNTRTNGASIRARVVAVNVNGGSPIWTGWSLDGANITEFELGGTMIQPNVDALQEFKVESANMPAEYGHTPTMVNAALKSGTNQFHGNLFEFLRNDHFDARNFFFRPSPGSTLTKDLLKRNQYGGTFGGPIRKDKTFFFADYEGTRVRQGIVSNSVVPSPAMRRGDFSELLSGAKPAPLVDPLNGQPFAGNLIPADRISPQARFFLPFLPEPDFVQGSTYRAIYLTPLAQNISKADIKIDHQLGINDRLMGRYSISNNDETDPNPFPALGAFPLHSRAQNATVSYTHLFGPKLLNDARFSYYRDIFLFGGTMEGTNFDQQAGVQGFSNPGVPSFPQINLSGYAAFTGSPSDQRPKSNRIRTWQYSDALSYTTGKHDMKFGAEWYHQTHGFFNGSQAVGTFNFVGTYSGNGFGDMLLGYPDNVSRDVYKALNGNWDDFKSFYFQDNYRVSSNLTLNLGLRWEINPLYNGIRGQVTGFDFQKGKVIIPSNFDPTAQAGTVAILPLFQDRILYTKDLGLPNSVRPSDHRDWGPRFGLAWRPLGTNRWVVRSGYGIFYSYPDTNLLDNTVAIVPFVASQSIFNDRPPAAPTRTWADFFHGQGLANANPNPGQPCPFGFVANSCDTPAGTTALPYVRNTYVQQWNFSVQREINDNIALDVAYVGDKTTRGQQFDHRNDPLPGPGAIQPRRPLPQWSDLTLVEWVGKGSYNALQVKLEDRNWHGLSLLASYAYSKCIDTASSEGGTTTALIALNRAVCDFDMSHSLVISYGYALPFGKGKALLSGIPGWADQVLGGWEIAGITTLQSGLPFTPTISGDRTNTGVGGQRPDVVAAPILPRNPSCWFYTSANPACTALMPGAADTFVLPPAQLRYGTGGRNILRADPLQQFDFTLLKNFRITESKALQFRSEFFNLFNHPTFASPSSAINVSSGGQIGSTLNAARVIQFALKLSF